MATKEEIDGPTKSSAGICMALAAKPKEPNLLSGQLEKHL